MKTPTSLTIRYASFAVMALLMFAGCSNKQDSESTAEKLVSSTNQSPKTSTGSPQPQQWMSEAQAWQRAGDYDKAAQYLLKVQRHRQELSREQSAAYWRQMTAFQSDLASRVAAGDPSAKAAAERLRAASMR